MILGIGSDLVDVRRIERVIERHGERFLDRIFTAAERAKAEGRARAAAGRTRAATARGLAAAAAPAFLPASRLGLRLDLSARTM